MNDVIDPGDSRMVTCAFPLKSVRKLQGISKPSVHLSLWRGGHCGMYNLHSGQTRFVSFVFHIASAVMCT